MRFNLTVISYETPLTVFVPIELLHHFYGLRLLIGALQMKGCAPKGQSVSELREPS